MSRMKIYDWLLLDKTDLAVLTWLWANGFKMDLSSIPIGQGP
jgi:hypothetical protein